MLRKIFGCFFSHTGKWDPMVEEDWVHKNQFGFSELDIEYTVRVQYRTCSDCCAVERRKVY